jgi:hypothetical protein
MFHPKVAYPDLEVKFNEKPFYLGGSQVPISLGINNNNSSNMSVNKVKGEGVKKTITKCAYNK